DSRMRVLECKLSTISKANRYEFIPGVPLLSNKPYNHIDVSSNLEEADELEPELAVEEGILEKEDVSFFREGDGFDVELDDEIDVEV
ncbi:hypothetical protein, partial [Mycobacterium tuberculosis]